MVDLIARFLAFFGTWLSLSTLIADDTDDLLTELSCGWGTASTERRGGGGIRGSVSEPRTKGDVPVVNERDLNLIEPGGRAVEEVEPAELERGLFWWLNVSNLPKEIWGWRYLVGLD